jgi:hypothetical protein
LRHSGTNRSDSRRRTVDDLSAAQMLLGSAGSVVIVGLLQYLKPIWAGLVTSEWENRGIPILTFLLAAIWQVIVVNVLRSMSVNVTFNGWILVYLTIICALSASGLFSSSKAIVRG